MNVTSLEHHDRARKSKTILRLDAPASEIDDGSLEGGLGGLGHMLVLVWGVVVMCLDMVCGWKCTFFDICLIPNLDFDYIILFMLI